jgi:hypothetical protein
VAITGRQEEITLIQLPNYTKLCLGSGTQSPEAITGCFEVRHYIKAEFTLFPRVIHILNTRYVWHREVFTSEFNKIKMQTQELDRAKVSTQIQEITQEAPNDPSLF